MSSQIRGWQSSELLPFIGNFATATWDHLRDIKVALSPHCIVNMSWFCVLLVLSMVVVAVYGFIFYSHSQVTWVENDCEVNKVKAFKSYMHCNKLSVLYHFVRLIPKFCFLLFFHIELDYNYSDQILKVFFFNQNYEFCVSMRCI